MLSWYYILTYFDDGTCIETVSRYEPLVKSIDRHLVRGGHDDLGLDISMHLDVVRERVESGARILPVRDLDMVKRLATYFYGHVASAESAVNVARIRERERTLVIMCVACLAVLVLTIVRAVLLR
jgi:hypothetical protein